MLNGISSLSFKIYVVAGILDIGLKYFPYHGTIMSPLIAEYYILNSGGRNIFDTKQNISLFSISNYFPKCILVAVLLSWIEIVLFLSSESWGVSLISYDN